MNKSAEWSYYNKTPGSPINGDASKGIKAYCIDTLINVSKENKLNLKDTAYVLSMAHHESGFNPYAAAGTTSARGLGQFIKSTGKRFGIDKSNQWDIRVQAKVLVGHFSENKAKAKKHNASDKYIHHDGHYIENSEVLTKQGKEVYANLKQYRKIINDIF